MARDEFFSFGWVSIFTGLCNEFANDVSNIVGIVQFLQNKFSEIGPEPTYKDYARPLMDILTRGALGRLIDRYEKV